MTEGTEFEGVVHDDVTSEFAPAVTPESPEPQPEQIVAPESVSVDDPQPEAPSEPAIESPDAPAPEAADTSAPEAAEKPEFEAAAAPDDSAVPGEAAQANAGEAAVVDDATPDEAELATGDPGQTDDLTAAIREANENLEAEPSLDDIAPGTVIADAAAATGTEAVAEGVDNAPWWPFLIYIALWIAFGVAMVMQFSEIPAGKAVYDAPLYPLSIIAGLTLMALGLVWILVVWLVTLRRPGSTKGGLFFSALLKGSLSIVAGVIIWWAALVVLDTLRLGSPL